MRRAIGAALLLVGSAAWFVGAAVAQEEQPDPPEKADPPAATEPADPPAAADPPVAPVARTNPESRDLEAYRLRVGDQVQIVVFRSDNLSRPVTVPANGDISFPPIGKVNLLDKTVFEIEERIAQRLKDGEYVIEPNVGCIVTQYAPRQVPIIGAVRLMVDLPVHKNIRLLELLARAGALDTTGQGGSADFSRVTVRRTSPGGRVIKIPVNVDDVLQAGDDAQNIIIREGDLIIIPRLSTATPQAAEWVYVIGSVNNAGRHPIIQGRTPFTLTKLIAMVGDFAQFADRGEVKIVRHTSTGRRFVELDFDEIIEGNLADFELEADDLIVVPERMF